MGEETDDLAGGFSKYRDELLARTGVDIQDAAGNYRNLYDIFVDIAKVWDNITDDQSRARVGEILGGTRNQAGIMSTITNIKDAMGAYETAMNSAGVAAEANNKYMETTAAHVGQLKASFQELSVDVFNSSFLKAGVDIIRGIVEGLDAVVSKIGVLGTALAGLGIGKFMNTLKGMGAFTSIENFISSLAMNFQLLGGSLLSMFGPGGIILGVFGASIGAYLAITESYADKVEKLSDSQNRYKDTLGDIDSLQSQIAGNQERINSLRESGSMTTADASEIGRLERENALLQTQLETKQMIAEIEGKQAAQNARDVLTSQNDDTKFDEQGNEVYLGDNILESTLEKQREINRLNFKRNELEKANQKIIEDTGKTSSSQYKANESQINNINDDIKDLSNEIQNNSETISSAYDSLFDANGNVREGFEEAAKSVEDFYRDMEIVSSGGVFNYIGDVIASAIGSLEKPQTQAERLKQTYEDLSTGASGYLTTLSAIQEAVNSQTTGKGLSLDTYNSEELKDYSSALEYHNGVMQYNLDKVKEITKAKYEEQKANVATAKAQDQADYLRNASEIEKLRDALDGVTDRRERAALNANINSLLDENHAIADACKQYNLVASAIDSATSAYSEWLNAQNASQSGEMFDSATSALNRIDEVLNDTTSDDYKKVGLDDYKAALDFVIPEDVDASDKAAVNSYIESISSLFKTDENGNLKGLNVGNFLNQAVEKGLMEQDGNTYRVAGEKSIEEFAEGMHLSAPLVQAALGELEEYGFEFHFTDSETSNTFGDLAVEANEAAEAIRSVEENSDIKLVLDVSKFEDKQTAIETLDENIRQMNEYKSGLDLNVDSSQIEHANSVIQYCVQQKQDLTAPAVMRVDTSQVAGEVGNALSLLQQFQQAQNTVEMQASVGADTSEAEAALSNITSQIQALPPEVTTSLNIDTTSIDTIQQSISNLSAEALVSVGVDSSAIDSYMAAEKTGTGLVTWTNNSSAVDAYSATQKTGSGTVVWGNDTSAVKTSFRATGTVTWTNSSPPAGTKIVGVNGTAHVAGTAAASGNWGTATGGTTLVGELGEEIVVNPHTGTWYTVGTYGPEFVDIPKNAIVFNHKQTESLLANGYAIGRASALASGTAMFTGGGTWENDSSSSGSKGSSGGGSSSSKSSNGKSKKRDTSNNKSSSKDKVLENFKNWVKKFFDWIEVKIDRISSKIERLADRAEHAADAGNYALSNANYRQAISSTNTQIGYEQKANTKYNNQAEKVLKHAAAKGVISSKRAKQIKDLDASGKLNIKKYNERTQEVIKDYQEWTDKAREAADKIEELHRQTTEYIAAIYENKDNESEAIIDLAKSTAENATDVATKNSYIDKAAKQYDKIISNDTAEINEYNGIIGTSQKSIASGKIVKKVTKKNKKTAATGTNYKNLKGKKGKATKKKVDAAIKKAKSAAKSGKAIPASVLEALSTYYRKGYVSGSFYSSCVAYNNALDNKIEAQSQLEIDKQTAIEQKVALGQEKFSNVEKSYQNQLDSIEAKNNVLQAQQNAKTTRGLKLTKSDYNALSANNAATKSTYENEIIALRNVINQNIASGLWTTATQEYIDAVNSVTNYEAKVQECIVTQEEYNNAIAQLPYDTIEAALELLDAIAEYNSSAISLKQAMGEDLLESDYLKQMEDNTKKIAQYTSQQAQAYTDYQQAIANADKVYGGKTADEWLALYNSAGASINNIKAENEQLKDSLRDDVYWRVFNRAHEAAQRLLDVVKGLSDLITDDMYFDKNGKLTNFGVAQVANLVKEYETARKEVQNYSNDINNLNKLYRDGQYTAEEYKEKLSSLQSDLLGAAKDMKSYMEDIKEMYKDMDEAELDALEKLIDARSDALKKKKEYYDYDKSIRSKSKDIQELRSQLAALEGVTGAAAAAQRARLQEQLSEAEEDLNDTQTEHYFDLAEDALSDLKDTIKDEFDEKWEKLGADLDAMLELMSDANALADLNASAVSNTLTNLLAYYGINAKTTGIDAAFASGKKRINRNLIGLSNESGNEILVTKNGIISRFNPGDGVLPANLSERLYTLAQTIKPNSSLGNSSLSGVNSSNRTVGVTQHYDSLINIEGSADAATVEDLKRMSSDLLEKSYNYTTQRINQDYRRTGGKRRI